MPVFCFLIFVFVYTVIAVKFEDIDNCQEKQDISVTPHSLVMNMNKTNYLGVQQTVMSIFHQFA